MTLDDLTFRACRGGMKLKVKVKDVQHLTFSFFSLGVVSAEEDVRDPHVRGAGAAADEE